jgi:hypothetical protein
MMNDGRESRKRMARTSFQLTAGIADIICVSMGSSTFRFGLEINQK